MRRSLVLALALLPGAALAGPGDKVEVKNTGPSAHPPFACGVKELPLAVGNSWTYEPVAAPLPPDDKLKRISPPEPKQVVITVKSIDTPKGGDTVITLTEKTTIDLTKDPKKPVIDERTIDTTITCNATKKFEVSPDSFFFAGEPGGYFGLKLDSFDRSRDTSWKWVNGSIGDHPWREDVVAHWTRIPTPGSDAKLGSGKLELERAFTPEPQETVVTKLTGYRTDKVALVTTGRVTLDGAPPDAKPMELPANWVATFWLANNVGIVQLENAYQHMYQLSAATLK